MRQSRQSGLTLVEVTLALAVIGILVAAFTTSIATNFRVTSTSGQDTQAVQVLNFIGRQVVGANPSTLPPQDEPIIWGYGDLTTTFTDLQDEGGFSDPDNYKVTVTDNGSVGFSGAGFTITRYDIEVCYQRSEEHCMTGTTLSYRPSLNPQTGLQPPSVN